MVRLPEDLSADDVLAAVRERYNRVGAAPDQGYTFPVGRAFAEAVGYPPEVLDALPADAVAAFAGVACPVPYAALQPGEIVIDLGCGAGMDSLYAARVTGPAGCVLGIDFAPAMVERARRAIAESRLPAVEARPADASVLPVADAFADAVIVNGIFNLNPDKRALMAEVYRVLKPGGRLVAAEIALTAPLPPEEGQTLEDWFR